MNPRTLLIPAIAMTVCGIGPALALPPGGVFDDGPPAAVVMNLPAGGSAQSPQDAEQDNPTSPPQIAPPISLSRGDAADPDIADAADLLGDPPAGHSILGAVAAYKSATLAAQADLAKYTDLVNRDQAALNAAQNDLAGGQDNLALLQNSVIASEQQLMDAQAAIGKAQAALVAAATQLTTDEAALTAAQAEISSAQTRLASAASRPLPPPVISRLNTILGI
jgi:hypothetical protein